MLGHKIIGSGSEHVLILHDWFSDTSSYDSILPYLSTNLFTYCFVDIRGYGRSKDLSGSFSVEEIYTDLLEVADQLGWQTFHLIGHSMTGLVVQYALAKCPHRLKRVIAVAPTAACGAAPMEENMPFFEDAAQENDEGARALLGFMTSNTYDGAFIDYKIRCWRTVATNQARLAYLHMYVRTNIVQQIQGATHPLLVVTGENDVEGHRLKDMQETLGEWFPNCSFQDLKASGHYPMQEVPARFTEVIEAYLKG
tara:strand:+ start:2315 stop:3073 length:759 start_codon:yes stop_codon:yes gene_type:complete